MAGKHSTEMIEVVHPICCGLDVHKDKISAALAFTGEGGKVDVEIEEFGTYTKELYRLRDWLAEHQCPVVGMESTGVYWHGAHNVLEAQCEIVLVNARHVKNVPGRKTDISDAQWLASLLRYGLLKGSFIPAKFVRQWRELTRLRKKNVHSKNNMKRRVQKVLESANIKIDSVLSDVFGKSGEALINLLLEPDQGAITLEQIQACLHYKVKAKGPELLEAIQGFWEDHHRFQLEQLLPIIAEIEKTITAIDARLEESMRPYQELLDRLDEVPGIDRISAMAVLAELGPDLADFAKSANLCSWGGLCPGNNESGGKRSNARSPVDKHHFKTIMVEIAWGAVRTNGSYYKEKYYRLKARRGTKRTIIAIAHRLTKAIFHIIKHGQRYRELGVDYVLNQKRSARMRQLRNLADSLGFVLFPDPRNRAALAQ
jgi:transposase